MIAPRVQLGAALAAHRPSRKVEAQPAAESEQERNGRQGEKLADGEDVEPHARAGPALGPEPSLDWGWEERLEPSEGLCFNGSGGEVLPPASPTRGNA